jgi:hypothetical protein
MTDFSLRMRLTTPLRPAGADDRPTARLLGVVEINGVPHHAEAIEVEERDGCQESAAPEFTNYFAELSEIAQDPMETITLDGRQYVMLITPFQD